MIKGMKGTLLLICKNHYCGKDLKNQRFTNDFYDGINILVTKSFSCNEFIFVECVPICPTKEQLEHIEIAKTWEGQCLYKVYSREEIESNGYSARIQSLECVKVYELNTGNFMQKISKIFKLDK